MLAPVRTVEPTVDLVSVSDAKSHCRIDAPDDDARLAAMIEAATSHLDGYSGILGRALTTQTWQQDFAGFCDKMRLPVGNLIEVTDVTYYDASNTQQTLASSVYTGFTDALGPYLALKPDQSWPSVYSRVDAVRVTWTAGYGATADTVPASIRHAASMLAAHWYDNRAAVSIGDSAIELPFAVNALLAPFRRVGT